MRTVSKSIYYNSQFFVLTIFQRENKSKITFRLYNHSRLMRTVFKYTYFNSQFFVLPTFQRENNNSN